LDAPLGGQQGTAKRREKNTSTGFWCVVFWWGWLG